MLSVVIPAHNEAQSIGATVQAVAGALGAAGIDYEIVVVDDASTDDTAALVQALGGADPRVRCVRSPNPAGFGFAVRAGLDVYRGDAVAIVMADLSDSPDDVVTYHRLLEAGYDCVFGSRFVPGSQVTGYPRTKLAINRLVNLAIRAVFRHGYNDTTNAFKAYRREVIDALAPLMSNQFNLTVELPLKAVVRGYTYAIPPISWRSRQSGESQLRLKEMGSRYAFIVLYVWLEHHLSGGDYRRAGFAPARFRARFGPGPGSGEADSQAGSHAAAHCAGAIAFGAIAGSATTASAGLRPVFGLVCGIGLASVWCLARGPRVAAPSLLVPLAAGGLGTVLFAATSSLAIDFSWYHAPLVGFLRDGLGPSEIAARTAYEFAPESYPLDAHALAGGLATILGPMPAMAAVGGLGVALLVCAAPLVAARRAGPGAATWTAVLVAAACVSIPPFAGLTGEFPVELLGLGCLALAFGLAMTDRSSPALAVGLASASLATKTTFLVPAVAVIAVAIVRASAHPRARTLAACAGAAVAGGGVWFVGTAVRHGSPFWPQLALPWGDARLPWFDRFPSFVETPGAVYTLLDRDDVYRFGAGTGLLVIVVVVLTARHRDRALALALAVFAAGFAAWANAPQTGVDLNDPVSGYGFGVAPRYLAPAVLCLVAGLGVTRAPWARAGLALGLAFNLVSVLRDDRDGLIVVALVAAATALHVSVAPRLRILATPWRARASAAALIAIAAGAAVAAPALNERVWRGAVQRSTDPTVTPIAGCALSGACLARAGDTLTESTAVGVLMGPELQTQITIAPSPARGPFVP